MATGEHVAEASACLSDDDKKSKSTVRSDGNDGASIETGKDSGGSNSGIKPTSAELAAPTALRKVASRSGADIKPGRKTSARKKAKVKKRALKAMESTAAAAASLSKVMGIIAYSMAK